MRDSHLLLVPSGGLANRIRAMVSAYHLCRAVEARLTVVWFQGWGMHAAFGDIFEPIGDDLLTVREARWSDYVVNDRPRRRNLWLPWLPQQLYYKRGVIHELQVAGLRDSGFDFEDWLRGHRRYMSCYDEFGDYPLSLYQRLFRPNHAVCELADRYQARFRGEYTIGMHIRRTDNIDSIRQSPLELFVEAGQREQTAHPDLTIFLATDSEEVKQQMRQVFGNRIVTSDQEASRDSVAGIREGLADMWTLSRTRRIYGSAGSSFSVMASRMGGVPLQLCTSA